MKNKKYVRLSFLLMVLIMIAGCVVWFIFTGIDNTKLHKALNSTISFCKSRIVGYDNNISNDRVKSLVRLLDKAEALRDDMIEYASFGQDELDNFAAEQRLTGVLVLDEDMRVVKSSMQEGDTESMWQDILSKDYIVNLLAHPEATYTEQLQLDDTQYDVAVVPRYDAPGLLLVYLRKDESSALSGDITLSSLFDSYPFEMSGTVLVCIEGAVVSSNDKGLIGLTSQDINAKYGKNVQVYDNGIFKIKYEGHLWYGKREKVGNYALIVLFPSTRIFIDRLMAMVLYAALALLSFMGLLIVHGNIEKTALRQSRNRMQIINAIGTAFSSISLIDMQTGESEIIKAPEGVGEIPNWDLHMEEVKQDIIGRLIDPEHRDEFIKFADINTIGERIRGKKSISITTRTIRGTWMSALIVPQRYDEHGNIAAVLLACSDISAEKEKEIEQDRNLRNALALAEHANKAKTNFLNSMSHDIRTPMNAIMGYTALATTHIDNKEQVMDYLQKISTSSQHLLSLINDVLDMSRIESGVVKLDESQVHLPDVLHDLRAIIQGNLLAKQHELYIDTQNIVHEDIVTDKLRLNQVLLNIVSNAIKFTPVGGTINIRVEEKPGSKPDYATYVFSVKDNGIGISKEFQNDIFAPFSREQTATKSGIQGTGLGMAISKNIVDMMGGTIKVNSTLGRGSEFIVTIECKISGQTISYMPVPELQGARALVVDDDVNTCMSVCKMLRNIDMVTDWTTTGKEAVFRAKEASDINRPFKVYIIDWQMPDMNGLETIRRIRRVIDPDTPIIILTAYDWTDIAQEAKEVGVTAFVSKPLFMSELRAALTQRKVEPKATEPDRKYRHKGLRVLLVEDNALNSEIATTILEEAGMVVDAVPDGIDAVERMVSAPSNQYDVILMDIQMPKMDGYTATREIRTLSDNKKANIPIFAMTANAFEEDKEKAFKAGMNGHISKPIDINTIMSALDTVFDADGNE